MLAEEGVIVKHISDKQVLAFVLWVSFIVAALLEIWLLLGDAAYKNKAVIFVALLGAWLLWVAIASRDLGLPYFLPGEGAEDKKLLSKEQKPRLIELQEISWSPRASRAATYSAISLAMILVAAILFVENADNLGDGQATLLKWVLCIASFSVVCCGVGVQLWEEAIGSGYDLPTTLRLRTLATVMSSVGWLALTAALALAVIVVDTGIGATVGAVGVIAAIGTLELKLRFSQHGYKDSCGEDRTVGAGRGQRAESP